VERTTRFEMWWQAGGKARTKDATREKATVSEVVVVVVVVVGARAAAGVAVGGRERRLDKRAKQIEWG
jgi:hypothetical protein